MNVFLQRFSLFIIFPHLFVVVFLLFGKGTFAQEQLVASTNSQLYVCDGTIVFGKFHISESNYQSNEVAKKEVSCLNNNGVKLYVKKGTIISSFTFKKSNVKQKAKEAVEIIDKPNYNAKKVLAINQPKKTTRIPVTKPKVVQKQLITKTPTHNNSHSFIGVGVISVVVPTTPTNFKAKKISNIYIQ